MFCSPEKISFPGPISSFCENGYIYFVTEKRVSADDGQNDKDPSRRCGEAKT